MSLSSIEHDSSFVADGKQYRMLTTSDAGILKLAPNGVDFTLTFPKVRIEIQDGSGNIAAYLEIDEIVLTKAIDMDITLDIEKAEVVEFKTVAHSDDAVEFKGVTLGLEQSIGKEIEEKLKTIPLGKIVILAGPVPIVFVFELGVYPGLGAELTLDAKCSIKNELSLNWSNSYGAVYFNGEWQTVDEKSYEANASIINNPSVGVEADLQAFLKTSVDTKIYGIAGPSIYLKPYDYSTVAHPPFEYELGLGIAAGLSFKVEILSWTIAKFNWDFLDIREPLVTSTEPGGSPPNTPDAPSGPSSASVGESVTFSATTTDTDGNQVAYQFDWGDGNTSSWTSYVSSGNSGSKAHSYSSEGTYIVKVKAKDENGTESSWSRGSTITVTTGTSEGELKWKIKIDDGWSSSSPSIGSNGTIYILSGEQLYAVYSDGSIKWTYQVSSDGPTPSIGPDGTIYFQGLHQGKGYLYAISSSGSLKWKYSIQALVQENSVAIGSDGAVYVGSFGGIEKDSLYAISPNGVRRWAYCVGGPVKCSPAIGSDGTIYVAASSDFGGDDAYLYALSSSGSLKWRYHVNANIKSSPTIGPDGTIYFGSEDTYLYAVSQSGSLRWRYKTSDEIFSSAAIGSDGTIYVGAHDNYFYAIDPDGTLKWHYRTGGGIWSSPAIGSDGTIYVGSNDKYLYALSSSGNLKWRSQLDASYIESPAIDSDGTIYIKDYCNLYAITSTSLGSANTAWPKFQHDNRNSGRYGGP